jgi:amino acid transporter
MLVAESRPRTLSWRHAGALLFGDWGTSRLYVLGLAFYFTGHASLTYLAVMSAIMAAVAWAYTIICRSFPDGGGVYAASRPINQHLAVFGATLLLCNFMVTAALSAVEGFHYMGLPHGWVLPAALVTLAVLGAVNWLGAQSAGRLALVIAVVAVGSSAVIGLLCLPLIGEGLRKAAVSVDGVTSPWDRWESLVRIVLALSGVEAVANMTGLMKQPVGGTARRTIWPVLAEVLILNLIFALALNAILDPSSGSTPDYIQYEVQQGLDSGQVPEAVRVYRDTAVKLLANETGARAFGETFGRGLSLVTGIVFALLLLSACNTAIMAMVSVMYSLARDGELPRPLAKLNYSGVPWMALIVACILPAAVVLLTSDVKTLAELYAIGVVGAITINLLSCAANKHIEVTAWERRGLWALGFLMAAIELTIIVAKPMATLFAGVVLGAVMGTRFVVHQLRPRVEVLPAPQEGWLAELKRAPLKLPPDRPRIMLAARGLDNAQYAVDLARRRNAVLFAIYVRVLRIMDVRPGLIPKIDDDPQAQEALGSTALLARQAGVPFFPIYINSTAIADEILDYAVTFGCDTVIMGKSRRSPFSRAIEGDVVSKVGQHLPEGISMVTRAAGPGRPITAEAPDTAPAEPPNGDDKPLPT